MTVIETLAGLATIIGAGVGVFGYFKHRCDRKAVKKRVIAFLKKRKEEEEKRNNGKKGRHSAGHLRRKFGITPPEIYALSEKKISHIYRHETEDHSVYYGYQD